MKIHPSLRYLACLVIVLAFLVPQSTGAPAQGLPADTNSQASPDQSLGWFYECVDCPKQFDDMTDRSLALDAGGYPHIAFGEIMLFHAWQDAGGWHTEVVDEGPGVGYYAAIDLDSSGFAHISYYDDANADLRYAYQDGSGWHIRIVDSDGSVGQHTSLGLDASRFAHISYYDETNHTLKFAHQDSSGWHLATLDNVGDVGQYTSLVMDSSGYAHISYYDKTNADLRYIYQDQAGWHPFTVQSTSSVGTYSSLALDKEGHRHVSFFNATLGSLRYIEFDIVQSSLSILRQLDLTAPASLNARGRYTSIAVDQGDKAHIVYSTYECMMWNNNDCWSDDPVNLMYTYDNGTATWPTRTAGYTGEHASLVLDATGKARLSYLNEHFGNLVYSKYSGTSWSGTTLESGGEVGLYSSLALDAGGYAHISYYDGISDYLQYASRSSTGWSIETVQTTGSVSTIAWGSGYISLVLDANQLPHISNYTGEGQQVLHYNYYDQDGWHILTPDSAGNPGSYSSMELDSSGYPHISYYKSGVYGSPAYDLRYVYRDASGWHPGYVDQTGDVGLYTSLELSSLSRPYISYYDNTNDNLKLAYKNDTGIWQYVIVDEAGEVGQYTSLALDASDFPHISYYDRTNGDLKYAFQDPTGWYTHTVDSQGDVGLYTSLALDEQSHARISYYDKTNGDLKYAYQDQAGWHYETVDNRGDVGMYSSLALDANGRAHIAYHDYSNKGLLYAYMDEASFAVSLVPAVDRLGGRPGGIALHTLRVTNNGNVKDSFTVALGGFIWATSTSPEIGPLFPGISGDLIVTVNIPAEALPGETDTFSITVTSQGDNSKSATVVLTTFSALTVNLPLVGR